MSHCSTLQAPAQATCPSEIVAPRRPLAVAAPARSPAVARPRHRGWPAALLLPALLALSGHAAAQRTDLLAIYRDAVASDPVFASARAAQLAAAERTPQARAALRPNVSAGLSASLMDSNYRTDFGRLTQTYNSWGPVLQATWPLYRPQLSDAVSQAQLAVTQSEAQLAQTRQDLILRVTQGYFDVLASRDALEALGASKQAVGENLAQAKREFEVGTKTIVDTHEAQARYDQIVAQEQVALGDLIVKKSALEAIIGRDPGDLLTLRDAPQLDQPQPPAMQEWVRRTDDGNFNVAFARAGAQIAQLETTRARDGRKPTVDLTGSLGVQRGSGTATTSEFYTQRSASIGVQLSVPLYTGGLIDSRVREALANEEKARQDLETARRNAAQNARQAFTGVDYGLAQVRALESAEVSAKSQLDSTRLGYQIGVRINLEVLDATTQLFNTQRDLKKARYDFLVNGLRLKSAAGVLEEQDLAAINALLAR